MLEYFKEREETERNMLIEAGGKAFVEANSDRDAILCEWKIANDVHGLSSTRAKTILNVYK